MRFCSPATCANWLSDSSTVVTRQKRRLPTHCNGTPEAQLYCNGLPNQNEKLNVPVQSVSSRRRLSPVDDANATRHQHIYAYRP